MLRLFIAIVFPQSIVEQFQNLCWGVRNARWVSGRQLHCTVRFIGECDDHTFHDIKDCLQAINLDQFELQPNGVGCFPPSGKPRILWVGFKPCPQLAVLRKNIDTQLLKACIPIERQKFHPHVTLARMKENADFADIIPFLSGNSLFQTEGCTITQFHLYSSTLRPEGALHQCEESFPLQQP
ncbi:MAG: RNA 2',3'-cyclic phosphodiesterase [Chitinivibrionales bacterium]|nr:RNA 2',3'-cyclic phosphodiesterase [Chitinivibrionales bacterium]